MNHLWVGILSPESGVLLNANLTEVWSQNRTLQMSLKKTPIFLSDPQLWNACPISLFQLLDELVPHLGPEEVSTEPTPATMRAETILQSPRSQIMQASTPGCFRHKSDNSLVSDALRKIGLFDLSSHALR